MAGVNKCDLGAVFACQAIDRPLRRQYRCKFMIILMGLPV